MRVGIDASNLRDGGSTSHLVEVLRAAEPTESDIDEVVVWAGSAVLGRLDERPWLRKSAQPLLEQAANPYADKRHVHRLYWQRFKLRTLAEEAGCDLLFVPGGMDNSGFRPFVTMSRNMLPFEPEEAARYGWSVPRLRLLLLRGLQMRSFRNADGLIFLTEYARTTVSRSARATYPNTVVIPHGVSDRFLLAPRPQLELSEYSTARPFRVLYVSTVDLYKHQWHVVEAVARLRARGLPVSLDLVGPAYPAGMRKLAPHLEGRPELAEFIHYRGAVPYEALHSMYERADLKVFASSCENMPNILLEAMMAGLPIACSRKGPMPEVLGEAGAYFDPDRPDEIAQAIETLA